MQLETYIWFESTSLCLFFAYPLLWDICHYSYFTPSSQKVNTPAVRSKIGRKRSLSENYLEHKPLTTVRSGDLLQPQMKKKKTVSTPRPRDFRSKQVDKYCLQHQEEDSQGDIKTALFKVCGRTYLKHV